MKKDKRIVIQIYPNEVVKQHLDFLAKKEDRAVSNLCLVLIKEALEARQAKEAE